MVLSDGSMQDSSSVPGSPSMIRRNSRTRRFSWRQDLAVHSRSVPPVDLRPRRADEPPPPLVTPCLDNLDLPYADDDPTSSTSLAGAGGGVAVRSSSPRPVPAPAAPSSGSGVGRRSSARRQSILARVQSVRRPGRASAGSGRTRSSFQQTGSSDPPRYRDQRTVLDDRKGEPTHFRWNASVRLKKSRRTSESYPFRRKSTDSVSSFRHFITRCLEHCNDFSRMILIY